MTSPKSHAYAGLMFSIKPFCNPPILLNFRVGDPLPSSHPQSLNNSRFFIIIHHRYGYDIQSLCSFDGEGHGCESEWVWCMQQGARWKRDRRYIIGDHRCLLIVRVAPNATASGSGESSQCAFARHDNGQACYLGANARRISTRTMRVARFPCPYRRDYAIASIGAVFLRRAPTTSGARRIPFDHNCAAQLHSTLYTIYSTEDSLSPSLFPTRSTVGRRKQILTSRTSRTISPRHCE